MALTDDTAARLFDRALLRGSFTLRSGAVSDRYFDKYRATTDPQLLAEITDAMAELPVFGDCELIVAPAVGAVPLAAALSLQLQLPFVIVRTGEKGYGTRQAVEGVVQPGARAVLVEDVVTSGGAALQALDAARAAGADVHASVCILDRDGGGREALAAADAPLSALLHAHDLDAAFERGAGTPA